MTELTALLLADGLTPAVAGRPLCRDLTLALRPGELWAVVGPNGSGKTTLLHTLAGLLPAQRGQVLLEGRPLAALRRRRIARRLGLVPQALSDPFPATVLETALIGRHPHLRIWESEGADDLAAARAALAAVELEPLAQRDVATLSGGERRRLALATLLTQDPAIALLDEPVNDLDLHHQIRVLGLLRALADRGRAIVAVLHDLNLAARFCDRALLLFDDGQWQSGPCREVLDGEGLSRLYRHPIEVVDGPAGPLFVPR